MRYMMLIYTKEADPESIPPEEARKVMEGHWAVMDETASDQAPQPTSAPPPPEEGIGRRPWPSRPRT